MPDAPSVFISHTTQDERDSALAHRLARALTDRGARVWIAPDSIPTGEEWKEHLVQGVMKECSHFLVIVSAASVQAQWVLREITLARKRASADASFRIVPLYVGKVGKFNNSAFLESLQKLAYRDDVQALADSIAAVIGLTPTLPAAASDIVSEKTQDFVGRDYVFAQIDDFLAANERGYLTIEGDPGVGKSAILAKFVERASCPAHFNDRALGINTPRHFLKSICAQVIRRFGLQYAVLPSEATRDGAFLVKILREAARTLSGGERLVIAVDALDEVDEVPKSGNILFLPKQLPKHVYFVLTRRKVRLPLSAQAPQKLIDLMKYREEGLRDVESYVRNQVKVRPRLRRWVAAQKLDAAGVATKLATLSEANFMYVRYVLPEVEEGLYAELNIDHLPTGLEGYYDDHWDRMGMTAKPLPSVKIRIVYVLSEAHKPVSRALIARIASDAVLVVDEVAVQEVLDEWTQFLRKHPQRDRVLYSVYHNSFQDFLRRRDIVQAAGVTLKGIHGLIADNLWADLFEIGSTSG